jgi:hypothetical protein
MALTPSDSQILNAAAKFRDALDKVDRAHWIRVGAENFPRGACQRVSYILAKFFIAEFGIELLYVHADFERGDHGWLDWNGLTIDITGDQFGWPRVIVQRNSQWHNSPGLHLREPIHFEPEWWGPYCAPIWNEVANILGGQQQE